MTDQAEFDFEAKQARDEGMSQVVQTDEDTLQWKPRALELIPSYPGEDATGEDLRLWLEPQLGPMHHPNLMGAVVRHALSQGLIERTGERRPMKGKASHARVTDVYRVKRALRKRTLGLN